MRIYTRFIILFLLTVVLGRSVVAVAQAAGPTVDHRFYIELPNGAKKKLEMKGVKIHKSVKFRTSNGDVANGRFIVDQCRYPDEGGLQRPITGGYHCATNESCFQEDIGAPYLPVSFNSTTKFNSLSDTSYMNFYNETFTTMLSREAPYLVQLYDPTSIRGFAGAKWVGNVDWAANNGGMEIMQGGTENPHGNEPIVPTSQHQSWNTVYGYSAPQSWGPGEVYRNPQGGNILQGRISWSLIPPAEPPPREAKASFVGGCQNKSCPAQISYNFKVTNIEPTDITSADTKSEFYIAFWANPWNANQKAAVRAFLGEPDYAANGDLIYLIGSTSTLKSDGGKPYLEFQWNGGSKIGKGGRTLSELSNWTLQQKSANQAVPGYSIGANLTIDGGRSVNGYVGGTTVSLLPDECSSCQQVSACTPITFQTVSVNQGRTNDGGTVPAARSDLRAISAEQDGSFYSMGFGGTFTIKLNDPIFNKPGDDISLREVTFDDRTIYVEKAQVEVSENGADYFSLGEAVNQNEVQYLDLAPLNGAVQQVNYIRMRDTTEKSKHIVDPRSDAYDIDAIGSCSTVPVSDKPTASMDGSIIACSESLPNLINLAMRNIDLKGNAFGDLTFRASFTYSAQTAKLLQFLGTPDDATWTDLNRSPINGDKFEYVLKRVQNGVVTGGNVAFAWDNTVIFGQTRRTLAQLTEFMLTQNVSPFVTVVGNLQTITPAGAVVENDRVGAVLMQLKLPCPICPITEQGPPNNPIILEPSNLDTSLPVTNNQVTVSWTQETYLNGKGNVVDQYEVLMYPSDPAKYPTPDAASAAATGNAAAGILPDPKVLRHWQTADKTNYAVEYTKLFTLPANIGDSVTIAIRSINNSPVGCAGQANSQGPWTIRPDLTLLSSFGGNFYKSESCNLASATPLNLTASSFVTITRDSDGQQYTANAAGSSYAVEVPAATADYFPKLKLDQAGLPEALVCSSCNPDTGDGFCTMPRTQGPTNAANFFLEAYNLSFVDSWWQTRSGLVYGHNGIKSTLPLESGNKNSDCAAQGDYCEPFLVRRDFTGEIKSAGIPMTRTSFSNVSGWWTDRTDQPHAEAGADNKSQIVQENYSYFTSKIQLPATDITGNISSPSNVPPGTELKEARLSYSAGSLRVEPDTTWVIPSGEKRIIFVQGDLTISQRTDQPVIRVEEGGFLAFVVSGSITFDATVGHENIDETTPNPSMEPNVEGVFIANGRITVASRGSDDKKFVAAGTYVGWSGVDLMRTFDNGGLGVFRNTTTPSETFIYRPDFVTSTPELFKFSDLIWKEVN